MADYALGSLYCMTAERAFYCVGVGSTNATFVSASDDATVFDVPKTAIDTPPIPLYPMTLDTDPPEGFVSGATLQNGLQRYILIAPLVDSVLGGLEVVVAAAQSERA